MDKFVNSRQPLVLAAAASTLAAAVRVSARLRAEHGLLYMYSRMHDGAHVLRFPSTLRADDGGGD